MAGGANDAQFTGLSKYFNTHTNFGRANISKATLGTMALFALYKTLTSKKKSPAPAK